MKAHASRLLIAAALIARLTGARRLGRDQTVLEAAEHRVARLQARVQELETSLHARLAGIQDAIASKSTATGAIVPSLKPEAHKVFFKNDYPYDNRPQIPSTKHFSYPYPIVQDSNTFDADYVKDANGDDGYWKAQMEYDKLRGQLFKEKKTVDEAKDQLKDDEKALSEAEKKAAAEKEDVEAAENAHKAAQKADEDEKTKAAEKAKAEKEASDAAAKANKEAAEAEKAKYDGDLSDLEARIKAQQEVVEKEKEDFEECKKQLEFAKQDLERLRREEAETKAKEEKEEIQVKEAKVVKDKAEEEEERTEEIREKDEKIYDAAHKDEEKQEKEFKDTENELDNAKEKVRRFRSQAIDDGDGHEAIKRNGAGGQAPGLGALVVACIFSLWYLQ